MACVSEWYPSLAYYTFPTVFIRFKSDERKSLLDGDKRSKTANAVIEKIQRTIKFLPGSCFIHADCCAPTDSKVFEKRQGSVNSGAIGWDILLQSDKIKAAFEMNITERICLHSFRRMDRNREFRMFIRDGRLLAMSQRYLGKHLPAIVKRREAIWRKAQVLTNDIASFLPGPDQTVDAYITSDDYLMIIDINDWGPPTDPLLLRDWDRSWDDEIGLQLVPKPVKMSGEVSVSF